MHRLVPFLLLMLLATCCSPVALYGQRLIDFEPAAQKLKDSTVTVSVTERKAPEATAAATTVCSGVMVGDGLLVSSIDATTAHSIRVSNVKGDRHAAQLGVVDNFTGLSLLECKELTGAVLPIDEQLPKSGSWVISGAAWGQAEPIITHGIVSSTQRFSRTTPAPPLIQCDLRSVETSSGAAIVGPPGKLLGVVIATQAGPESAAGTFAVPARHVKRLLRSRVPGQLVVLKRQRPTVGLTLSMGDQPEQVVVERVVRDGPADRVGLTAGDTVVSVDNQRIRWVYEALRPVLQRQPGDSLKMVVLRDGKEKEFELVLGGGITLPAGTDVPSQRSARRLKVSRVGENEFAIDDLQGGVRALRFDAAGANMSDSQPDPVDVLQRAGGKPSC